jgi:hypothetical protein
MFVKADSKTHFKKYFGIRAYVDEEEKKDFAYCTVVSKDLLMISRSNL